MRLVVCAAGAEAAFSAISNGADEILLAPSVQPEALTGLFTHARARGCAVAIDLSRACNDSGMHKNAELLRKLYALGLDAVMVGEPGMMRLARQAAPSCRIIWGNPCQSADDVQYAASQDCSRAVLSPYLPSSALLALAKAPPLPLAAWVLCPLCLNDDRDACLLDRERGAFSCAESCRKLGLTPRDLCLLGHMREFPSLTAMILPPDPSPEAAGFFTRIARETADNGYFDERAVREALAALGREAPTAAPYTGVGEFFIRDDFSAARNERFWDEEKRAERPERPSVPVRFMALIRSGEPSRLAVDDYRGHTLFVEGAQPSDSGAPASGDDVNAFWLGSFGMYRCNDARTQIDPGLRLSEAEANLLRRRALEKLSEARMSMPEREKGELPRESRLLHRADKPCITVKVSKMAQVTDELLSLTPERLYIPLAETDDLAKAEWLVRSETVPVAVLPKVVADGDRSEISARLKRLYDIGYREALTWTPGQAMLAARHGFAPRADWGSSNTQALRQAKAMGVISSTLAPWLTLAEVRELNHLADTELVVYGRLTLLLARQCLIKKKNGVCSCDNVNELPDGQGGVFPLTRGCGHRTAVLAAQKLWMEPYRKQWRHIGLWAARLDFTTENARECIQTASAYAGKGDYAPHAVSTGFYSPAVARKWF